MRKPSFALQARSRLTSRQESSGYTSARKQASYNTGHQKFRLFGQRALIAGCGSIGRRHSNNLQLLGVRQFGFCDTDETRLKQCHEEFVSEAFTDYRVALEKFKPSLVLICTPPVYHVEQALAAVEAGAHVFIEKPLSHQAAGIRRLIQEAQLRERHAQVGYNLRFHPGLRILKKLVDSGRIGRVLWLSAEAGQYLPDWRPWQNYRESYSAMRELGGGILLDGSHEMDYICWLLGRPTEVTCRAERISDLEVDVEDSAWVHLGYPDRRRAQLHLDFVQRTYTRTCKNCGRGRDRILGLLVPRRAMVFSEGEKLEGAPLCFRTERHVRCRNASFSRFAEWR